MAKVLDRRAIIYNYFKFIDIADDEKCFECSSVRVRTQGNLEPGRLQRFYERDEPCHVRKHEKHFKFERCKLQSEFRLKRQ